LVFDGAPPSARANARALSIMDKVFQILYENDQDDKRKRHKFESEKEINV
jgi:hypothetical protein